MSADATRLARYVCDDADRRGRKCWPKRALNGIDDVEVDDRASRNPRRRTLLVRCLRPLPAGCARRVRVDPAALPPNRPVEVTWAPGPRARRLADAAGPVTADDVAAVRSRRRTALLVVRTDTPGDLSPYRLVIATRAAGFDPRLAAGRVQLRRRLRRRLDCAPARSARRYRVAEPVIDYLSRDYAGLRQLLLDRLSVVAPAWTDRNAADIGVMLVEIFAYLGDLARGRAGRGGRRGLPRHRPAPDLGGPARPAAGLPDAPGRGRPRLAGRSRWTEDVSAAFARRAACMPAERARPT